MRSLAPLLLVAHGSAAPAWKVRATLSGEFPRVRVAFRVEGALPWAPAGTARVSSFEFAPELWKHSCFEMFIGVRGQPAYHEWNFAPDATAYAHFGFRAYRERTLGGALIGAAPLAIGYRHDDAVYEIEVELDLGFSPGLSWAWMHRRPLDVLVSAILEPSPGIQTFWAPEHPVDKPDFHRRANYRELFLP